AAERGCGRGTANVASTSVTPPYPYSEVRGFVRAYASGGTDAFRDTGPNAEGLYLDGIAITVGSPRRHVFAFASGVSDAFGPGYPGSECPCEGGPQPPLFVGDAYRCESARASVDAAGTRDWDHDDVLFDGEDIDAETCVNSPESHPDFSAVIGGPTTEVLEVHVMQSQDPADEDLALSAL